MGEAQEIKYREKGLNSLVLKLIAAAAMLTDHVAYVFLDGQYAMRSIGRLAFPIFAFFIVEGYIHTHDVKKYAIRLFLFALVAQAPYFLAFGDKFYYPNVIFTLFLGLMAIYAMDKTEGMAKLIVPFALAVLAELTRSDHGAFGVLMIIVFYMAKPIKKKIFYVALLILFMQLYIVLQNQIFDKYTFQLLFYLMPLVLLYFYNGEKGSGGKVSKWLFYVFYPIHLALIWIISLLIN